MATWLALAVVGTAWAQASLPVPESDAPPTGGAADASETSLESERLTEELQTLRGDLSTLRATVAAAEESEPRRAAAARHRAAVDATTLRRGERVYRRHCATCHGRQGDGEGPTARFLRVTPRDFTRAAYKWRTTPSGSLPSDGDLLRTVRVGAPGTPMPSWEGRLSDESMEAVVQFIKRFSRRFAEEEPEPAMHLPQSAPELGRENEARGRMVYVLMQCWTCHGMSGDGNGPAADTLVDDLGEVIEAYDFTRGTFRSGGEPTDVYRTFTTGVNGTPMPSYHEALMIGGDTFEMAISEDPQQFSAVLGPAGMTELGRFVATLPTTDEIWALSDEERDDYAGRLRWDLVSYVLALSRGSAAWRYFSNDPYVTR